MSTETALLEAAERVLAERGIQATTVADMTAAAGVAKGTFYLYFSTKEDVIRALQRRHFQAMLDRVADAAAKLQDADWWDVVDSLIETIVDYDCEQRDWYCKVIQGWAPPPTDVDKPRAQIHDLISGAIRTGMAGGHCHAEDPEFAALLLQSALEGSMQHLFLGDEEIDRDRLVHGFQQFVRKVLAVPHSH